ncbi:hypothetical protein NDU88_004466 [Pleurodeles waltl]|uniref:Small ribosomal subunit protein uS7 domain-containing protein n=1 Tax=Pleurodeles waltl TaxID=8319 RepID=A0AAV7WUR0_PLEWA|nr:hypothetical protein NDU88_004466 [Pleurodeles waltl]
MTKWEPAPTGAETPEINLFGKWSTEDVQINNISLQDYLAVKEKYAKYLPHSSGRYAAKRFCKAQCPIVERLTDSMMMHGRNYGTKLMMVHIVKHAFEIIHLLTSENPPPKGPLSMKIRCRDGVVCVFVRVCGTPTLQPPRHREQALACVGSLCPALRRALRRAATRRKTVRALGHQGTIFIRDVA